MCTVIQPPDIFLVRYLVCTTLLTLTLSPNTRAQTPPPQQVFAPPLKSATSMPTPAVAKAHGAQSLRQLVTNAKFWTQQGRPDLAQQIWLKVLRIAPDHAQARMAMGVSKALPAVAPSTIKSRHRARQPSQKVAHAATSPALHTDPWALLAMAKQLDQQQHFAAQALMEGGVQSTPDDPDMRYAAALFARLTSQPTLGLAQLAAIDETRLSPSMRALRQDLDQDLVESAKELQNRQAQQQLDDQLQQLDALLEQEQTEVALAQALQLQTQYPAHPHVAWQVAKAASAAQQWPLARHALAHARELSRQGPDSSRWIEALAIHQLDDIEARRQPYVEIANYRLRKPGDTVASQLHLDNTRLQMVWPQSDTGHWLLKFDRHQLDPQRATSLTLLTDDGATTTVAAAFDASRWRLDLGTTPSAAARTRWTGGGLYRGETDTTQWRLSLARRPVANSLLSYLGQRDPGTGLVWGGVDRTALQAQARTAWGERVSTSVNAGTAHYAGEHVGSNQERFASANWGYALVHRADVFFEISPGVRWQSFANNQNRYALGYGGYYSPQQLLSPSVSLTSAQRTPSTSWLVRGNWNHLNSRNARTGVSWQGGAEHRLHPNWVLGAYVSHERAPEYQQNTLLVLLRWYKKGQLEAPSLWPTRNFLGFEP